MKVSLQQAKDSWKYNSALTRKLPRDPEGRLRDKREQRVPAGVQDGAGPGAAADAEQDPDPRLRRPALARGGEDQGGEVRPRGQQRGPSSERAVS